MKFAELTEIGWGIYKYKGDKWVAVEEDELMNMETGEIEKIKEDYKMKKLERWEIARGKELVEFIESVDSYDMCEEEVKELIALTGLGQEWEDKHDEFELVLWKAMDIVKGQNDER